MPPRVLMVAGEASGDLHGSSVVRALNSVNIGMGFEAGIAIVLLAIILDRISRHHGANSVSEFLRQLIMNAAPVVSATRRGTREVSEELDALKREVDRLSQVVERSVAT